MHASFYRVVHQIGESFWLASGVRQGKVIGSGKVKVEHRQNKDNEIQEKGRKKRRMDKEIKEREDRRGKEI